jgi:nitrous oxidase accessory protein NosD
MIFRPRVALTLLAALFALALPATASAVVYEVDSTGDEVDVTPGVGGCLTAGVKCTLRAALEESNFSTGVTDTILFKATEFQGQLADTITPATALPKITSAVEINGATCLTEAGVNGPCVGIKGPAGQNALTVEADDTSISSLSITEAATGISVINATTGFTLRGSWIGLKLNGVNGGSSNTGVFIDPDSNGATIGGSEPVQRNVISFNSVGLDIEGADDAVIRGNWFGLQAQEGGIFAGPAGKNIEISDSTAGAGFKAEGNEIGAVLGEGAVETTTCDGGCNVISGSTGISIDLNGNGAGQNEAPASGPTTIHGNFVGLNAPGTGVLDNSTFAILAGGADNVQVGGATPTETNYIAGSGYGIYNEGGESFQALGNVIGTLPSGGAATPPSTVGVFVFSLGVSEEAEIENNDIRMAGGIGIEHRFSGARIIDNDLEGGSIGIWTRAEPGGGLIAGNVVEAPGEYGILVESPDNEVRRNSISGSGGAGIRVKSPPGIAMTGNLIGGNTAERENVIEGSNGAAIEIFEEATEPGSTTEIARNRGSANGGLFIDLVGGANEGVLPPGFSSTIQSKAEGTALPGATIRVFRKASAETGELQSFLGETVADGSGNWKVGYGSIPTGTIIAATQTNANGGTSELATATAGPDPVTPGGGGNGGGGNGGPGPVADTTAPKATISKGPKAKSANTTAKFKFKSNEAGSKFQCKLDKGKFKNCRSPKTYKKLKPGKHVFKVRAVDKAGNVGKPAKRKFTVLG